MPSVYMDITGLRVDRGLCGADVKKKSSLIPSNIGKI